MPDNNKKILLVDDEELILKLTRTTLAGEGFEIHEAQTGEKAMDVIDEVRPDLVLLDVNLPDIDGLTICRKIKQNPEYEDIYVIILTGILQDETEAEGKEAGADGFFHKPFSPIELLKRIHQIFLDAEVDETEEERIRKRLELFDEEEVLQNKHHLKNMKEDQLLMYAMDLSTLHKKEIEKSRELKKAYAKLKEMEKMKDSFIALVSHELRTPLSIIKGYLFLLQEVLNKSSALEQDIEQDISGFMEPISRATGRLETLISELLDFSRMKSGLMTFEKKEIVIPDFLKLILQEFRPQFAGKNIDVKFEAGSPFRPIKADHERLREAFTHFIKNALNFTQPGGSFKVTCKDEGIWIEIKFSDTGVGISEEKLNKIFSPFYQTAEYLTRKVGGMGLGLSISKHIVEDHGGNITVDSKPGKGTTFTIRLPRSYQDAKEIVAELKQTYPKQLDELSKNLKATQHQLMAYAQQLSGLYAKEKQRVEQLEETLNELEGTYIQTLVAMSKMVDLKDAYSERHTDRVSFYASAIAKKLNPELLNDRNFKYSLLLHDVGKIGVAENLLGKVGKLTDEEWSILQGHSEKGVEIFEDIEFLTPALNAIRSHHERWDGKGYPDGLKGEEIPLSARIIAVADSFDAMTTNRPYRDGMSMEQARREIIKQKGYQFDPEVVRCFNEAWDEIEEFARKAIKVTKLEQDLLEQDLLNQ